MDRSKWTVSAKAWGEQIRTPEAEEETGFAHQEEKRHKQDPSGDEKECRLSMSKASLESKTSSTVWTVGNYICILHGC